MTDLGLMFHVNVSCGSDNLNVAAFCKCVK